METYKSGGISFHCIFRQVLVGEYYIQLEMKDKTMLYLIYKKKIINI